MDHNQIIRFFDNKCSVEETKQVLEWFATEEGQRYLDSDFQLLQEKHITPLPMGDSEEVWGKIEAGMEKKTDGVFFKSQTTRYWQAAAAIAIIIFSSFWLVQNQQTFFPEQEEQLAKAQPIHYRTGDHQQKILTLQDGTQIRLNSNAQIWIPRHPSDSSRDVTLQGEAYFEVVHNSERPFTIHTRNVTIRDIGTAFNVRALPNESNVQIAVKEGKVAVTTDLPTVKKAKELTSGQFAYVDLHRKAIHIDSMGVSNYMSWMTGRLTFNQATLEEVSRQLGRIYNISFSYSNDWPKRMTLTTDFERKPLKKVLEIISLTLHIQYRMQGQNVVWIKKNSSHKNKKMGKEIYEFE